MDERSSGEQLLAADPGLAALFLGRFASLMIRQLTTQNPDGQRMSGEAMLSIFRDCVNLGLAERVFDIMDYIHDALPQDDDLAA
jgi:hypothetical protein